MATPRYSIPASSDRATLCQTLTDLEDAGWEVKEWLPPYVASDDGYSATIYTVVLRLKEKPAFVRETSERKETIRLGSDTIRLAHDFTDTYRPEGKRVVCPREGLIAGCLALLTEAQELGLPTPENCPRESLETVGNSVLYSTGIALKKRISAARTLSAGEPEKAASAQMQGA
jgi:hypothetical protein